MKEVDLRRIIQENTLEALDRTVDPREGSLNRAVRKAYSRTDELHGHDLDVAIHSGIIRVANLSEANLKTAFGRLEA